MASEVRCPFCGETREIPSEAEVGARRCCRHCWTVLEVVSLQPPQVVKIPHCAEDFGI